MNVIGIDPGLMGGIAILGKDGPMVTLDLHPMPTIAGKDYGIPAIKRIVTAAYPQLIVLEQQIAMPGQGLSSTLQTGKGFGILLGLLSGLDLPHQVIPAKSWQSKLFTGVSSKLDTKAKSEIIAKRLFPNADFRRSDRARKNHDGLTDAACIAAFARRLVDGVGPTFAGTMKPHTALPENPNVCIRCGTYIPTDELGCNYEKEFDPKN